MDPVVASVSIWKTDTYDLNCLLVAHQYVKSDFYA